MQELLGRLGALDSDVAQGLRVIAWWEESPLGAILAAGEALVRLAFQVASTCIVMVGVRRSAPGWPPPPPRLFPFRPPSRGFRRPPPPAC